MNNDSCPYCGEKVFTIWKKLNIGVARKIYCPQCNSRVTVQTWKLVLFSIYSQFTGVIGVLVIFGALPGPHSLVSSAIIFIIGYILGAIPSVIFYANTTPLIKKGT